MKKIDGWVTAPQGFLAAGVKAGIKASGNHDVAVIYSTVPAATGAVFTQNKMCAAPVLVSREVAQEAVAQAIIVNSGCANACTGEQGLLDAREMQAFAADLLGIEPQNVYVCSTGVIGHFLPMDKIKNGLADAVDVMDENEGESCAMAIQTTDTFIKRAAYEFEVGGKTSRIAGIAKGAGMIHPNMATMLTFLTTDAAIAPDVLKRAVKAAADKSFNMVVVDGDTSTNDSMIVLANGLAENEIIFSEEHPDYQAFFEALVTCAQDLAKLIARDGEGATKFLEVNVVGAATWKDAKAAAMAIAKSPLVKTAFLMNADKVNLSIGGVRLVENGMNCNIPLTSLTDIMSEHDITMTIDMAAGNECATVWTCDFSYEYVKINGEYHT